MHSRARGRLALSACLRSSCLACGHDTRAQPLVDAEPSASYVFGHPLLTEHLLEQSMPPVEMSRQKGQFCVRLRKRLSKVPLRPAEKSARKGDLLLDDVPLVLSLEQESDHRVPEKPVVEGPQDGAHPLFTTDGFVRGRHENVTSAPVACLTTRAIVA